ncbi:MAG: BspA family leucine-rich repeat surface protein [Lachnospiraceae bacterium]|nr:BspA family leucine-rich repeat surface protein [Lachnospiraceae bacterium]
MKIKRIQSILIALLLIAETITAPAMVTSVNAQTVSGNTVSEETVSEDTSVEVVDETEEESQEENKSEDVVSEEVSAEGATIKYSGKSGDLDWSIDYNGLLTITGEGDYDTITMEGNYIVAGKECTDLYGPHWIQHYSEIKSAKVSVTGITDMGRMFAYCEKLTSVDFSGSDTSQLWITKSMFQDCCSLKSLNLSDFNTSQVVSMWSMFEGCSGLVSLDLSSFETGQLRQALRMFAGCTNLTDLDLSSFDMSQVTNVSNMFEKCSNLVTLKSPYNINIDVQLPDIEGQIWFDDKVNACNTLKKGLSNSVTYTRHKLVSMPETTVSAIPNQIYAAKALTPKPVVTYQGTKLTEGTDYTLSYANNTNPGTATITITGKGKYTGAKTVTFKIEVKLGKSKLDTYELNYQKGNVGKLTSKIYFLLYLDFVPVDYATKYEIELTNNKGKKVKTVKVNCANKDYVEKTIKNLTGTVYGIRIRAINDDVYGPWSTKRYIIRQPRAQARTIKGYVQIKWEKISGATGYDIYMSTKRNSGYKKVASAGKSTTLKTIKKFNKKKLKKRTYYYYVVAKKKVSGKTYKSTRSFVYKVKNK